VKNNRVWIVGTAVVSLAILVLGYLLGVAPKIAEAGAADAQTAQVGAANRVKVVELANLKKQFDLIEEIKASLAELQVSIPTTPEYSTWTRDLNRYADESKTNLYGATTSTLIGASTEISAPSTGGAGGAVAATPAPAASGAPSAGPSDAAPTTGETFNAVPITITVRGSYAQVTDFIRILQAGNRLVLIVSMDYHIPSDFNGYEVAISGAIFTFSTSPDFPDVIAGPGDIKAPATPDPTDTASPTLTPTPGPSATSTPSATSSPSPSN
jgi:Tfp pilus assembly protein PilO